MSKLEFIIFDQVKRFPGKGGWYYIAVPQNITEMTSHFSNRGLVPIKVKFKDTIWQTSLLPMGDGTKFIALKSQIRAQYSLELGDKIELTILVDML